MDASYLLKKSNKDQTMSKTEKLQQYFNFTQSDLQANRQGRVTENQRAHIKAKVQRYNNRILIVLGVVLVIGFIANFAIRIAAASDQFSNFFSSLPMGAVGSIFAAFIMVIFLIFRTQKKNEQSLLKAEGTVNFVWVENRISNQDRTGYKTIKNLQMRVGGVSFNVNENLIDIINQGDNARFYYSSGGDIVSAEFVEK